MNNNSMSSPVPALDKGLDILEWMASASEPRTLTQIARGVGRSVSEIQRMVAGLEHRAYLVRDPLGAFRLSSKLFRLSHTHPPYRDLLARALPAMQDFVDHTGESVHIGILSEDRLLLIGQIEGRAMVRITLQIGSTHDPMHTVSGRLLLSGLSAPELSSFMERHSLSRKQQRALHQKLAAIRKRGYESSESETIEGIHDIAAPVALPGPQIIAALASAWLRPRQKAFEQDKLLQRLRTAARSVAASYEPATPKSP